MKHLYERSKLLRRIMVAVILKIVQFLAVVFRVIEKGMQKTPHRAFPVGAHIHTVYHSESAERGHICDDIIYVREIPAVRTDCVQVPAKAGCLFAFCLKRLDGAESKQMRFDVEIVIQVLAAQDSQSRAERPAQDLCFSVRMSVVQTSPAVAYLMLDRQIHISPSVVNAKLKRSVFKTDRVVISA